MSKYEITVKHGTKFDGISFACVSISLSNPNLTGERLGALLSWVSRNFSKCLIDLADTLNRHNLYQQGEDPQAGHDRAKSMGDKWLAENQPIIAANLDIPFRLTRYDEWLEHPEYMPTLRKYISACLKNAALRNAVCQDSKEFLSRKGITRENPKYGFLFRRCVAYQLDELAQQTLIAATYPESGGAMIYPSQSLRAMALMRSGTIKDAPSAMTRETYLEIRFKSKSAANDNSNNLATKRLQHEKS